MAIIFVNTLEQVEQADGLSIRGQVHVQEEAGQWMLLWSQCVDDETEEELWYEGDRADQLMAVYHERMQHMQSKGFHPVLAAMSTMPEPGRVSYTRKLLFYGETHHDQGLFERLRMWRKGMAVQQSKAPYMVASNKLLVMLSAFVPHTLEQLQQIPGLGQSKIAEYGDELLKQLIHEPQPNVFPLDRIADAIDLSQYFAWETQQRLKKETLANDRQRHVSLISQGVARGARMSDLVDQLRLTQREIIMLLEEHHPHCTGLGTFVAQALGEIREFDAARAEQAIAQYGDRYLKPILHAMYSEQELKEHNIERLYEALRLYRLAYRDSKRQTQSA